MDVCLYMLSCTSHYEYIHIFNHIISWEKNIPYINNIVYYTLCIYLKQCDSCRYYKSSFTIEMYHISNKVTMLSGITVYHYIMSIEYITAIYIVYLLLIVYNICVDMYI